MNKLTTESLAKPVILRGSDNERPYVHQEIQTVQYGAVVGQVNLAHQPPTVSGNFALNNPSARICTVPRAKYFDPINMHTQIQPNKL